MSDWTYIKDAKPEKFGRYLFSPYAALTTTGWYLPKYDTWVCDRRVKYKTSNVLAWMVVPKDPKAHNISQQVHDDITSMMEDVHTDIDMEYCLMYDVFLDS